MSTPAQTTEKSSTIVRDVILFVVTIAAMLMGADMTQTLFTMVATLIFLAVVMEVRERNPRSSS